MIIIQYVRVFFLSVKLECMDNCDYCDSDDDCIMCGSGFLLDKKENRVENVAKCVESCRDGYYVDIPVCQSI